MAIYEVAVLGSPSAAQLAYLKARLTSAVNSFQLKWGTDFVLEIQPPSFAPNSRTAAAAIFYGGSGSASIDVASILDTSVIPILPVASTESQIRLEIPPSLCVFNCLFSDRDGSDRIFSALLECIGLLPRRRRVFLSYRRSESTHAAVQLFAELSARQFEVFLDTHGIDAAEDFQDALWHQLCDVDVLIMLETKDYFGSRWTSAEFGRALAKGIGVLRVQWPDATPSIFTATSSRVELVPSELDSEGRLDVSAIVRICEQLEQTRGLNHAVRHLSMVSAVQSAIERIGGRLEGIGANRTMFLSLSSGKRLVAQAAIGVPTAVTLQEAVEAAGGSEAALVYDHLGLKPKWQSHLAWLASSVSSARWIKVSEAAWDFAGWET